MKLTKKQLDKLFEVARLNNPKWPVKVTLNVGKETALVTLYENGKHKIHKGKHEVERLP